MILGYINKLSALIFTYLNMPNNMIFKVTIFVNRKRNSYRTLSMSYTNAITATIIKPSRGRSVKRPISYKKTPRSRIWLTEMLYSS